MNIKAERIEQLIQLVNRNLSLVFAGQIEGVTPLEIRKLQKVDAVIFGHDKFAYEMVHFISNATDKLVFDRSLFAAWESNFIKGLESLLVECAVIHDDIERDCFISRVYCWFTEKLAERREVPRDVKIGVDDLKASVSRTSGGNALHTMRAIDNYRPEDTLDGRARLMAEGEYVSNAYGGTGFDPMGTSLPPVLQQPSNGLQPRHPKFGARKVPLYVKHAYPGVLGGTQQQHMFQSHGAHTASLPKLPGAEENYGLVHNRPETAAEKSMNELWLARRQQEAFQHKTQQQLALVMDRLALHRARLESDALRRQESETMMKAIHQEEKNGKRPVSSSLERNFEGDDKKEEKRKARGIADRLRVGMGDGSPLQSPLDAKKRQQRRSPSPPSRTTTATEMTVSSLAGGVETQSIPAPNRIAVPKAPNSGRPTNLSHTPMRFKLQLPPDYLHRQQFYMQLSDDEEEEEIHGGKGSRKTAKAASNAATVSHLNKGQGGKNRSGSAPAGKGEILFKRERVEICDRPASAMLLKDVAANDNELKVHYRHTNFRRMPLTDAQLVWCEAKEQHRKTKSETMARELAAAVSAKGKGGKEKKDNNAKKDNKNKGKGKDGKNVEEEDKVKPKYATVQEFMATHFPKFEEENDVETMAPMRAVQITEVNDIVDTFAQYHLPIKEAALKKALVIPMDKPEAVCLEGLRENKEGLMQNPLPPEFWRVCKIKGAGGKKGKKGKKKK